MALATPKKREGRELMVEMGCSGEGGRRLKKKEKFETVGGERGVGDLPEGRRAQDTVVAAGGE